MRHDADLAEAILDRLLERGTRYVLRGRSYRTRNHREELTQDAVADAANPPGAPEFREKPRQISENPQLHSIMRVHIIISAAIAAVTLTPAFAMSQQTSPYETDICPIPAGVRGYTIVVRPEGGTNADTTYLKEIANGAGGFFTGKPREAQQATVLAVVRRDGRLQRASLVQRSGNNQLDRGALSSIRQAFEHNTDLSPSGFTADSLVIRVLFGEEPREGETTFRRFSAQHRLPEFVAPRGRMEWPADLPAVRVGGLVVAWVRFDKDGTASLSERDHPIQASDSRFTALVRAVVPRLRFVPGQSDCEPTTYVVPVRFDFSERTHFRLRIL